MQLAFAIAHAEARAYISVLAARTASEDAAQAYRRALIYLDEVANHHTPPSERPSILEHSTIRARAYSAIEDLADYGLDVRQIEVVQVLLDSARELDERAT